MPQVPRIADRRAGCTGCDTTLADMNDSGDTDGIDSQPVFNTSLGIGAGRDASPRS